MTEVWNMTVEQLRRCIVEQPRLRQTAWKWLSYRNMQRRLSAPTLTWTPPKL